MPGNGFSENNKNGFVYLTSKNLETGVRHLFTTRFGGVSDGPYSSMNLGLNRGDSRENVLKNFSIAADVLSTGLENFVLSTQIHEDKIICVTKENCGTGISKPPFDNADGLITNEKGVTLCIFTADCVPVLLYDPVKQVIGAVHSGWRGTVADICGKAVKKMKVEFGSSPEDILCAIGPCIGKCHFEIGAEVAKLLKESDFCRDFVFEEKEKFSADLTGMNRSALKKAGIREENISSLEECTFCYQDKYFSHRATGGNRGSLAAMITL